MATYEAWLTGRGLSDSTIHARLIFYRHCLEEWRDWDVAPDVLARWLHRYDGWTRITYQNHLTSIYDWLLDEGQVERNPVRGIRKPPAPRPRPRHLSEDELRRALTAARGRTRAYLLLGYLAGLRAHEIAKIHGRDISEGSLYVVGKGSKAEALPTHPLLWQLAQLYPRREHWFPSPMRPGEPIQARSVSAAVGKVFREVGIEGATHRARHTYATRLLRGGANVRVVQELLRHASLATTALYLGVDEDERRTAILRLVA